ncbi:ATP-binding protein [Spirillospora sp. NPDC048824]|uniref:ATP-binding protein n=1 Tax=Spirillospora sp. NPDC048824 TaxID=3364526 RepID=UPI00371B7394
MDEAGARAVVGEVTLPGVRRSVGCARSFVREVAGGRRGPDGVMVDDTVLDDTVLDDMVTVASETVANAITHTASGLEGGEVTLVLWAGDGVFRLEVADDGATGQRPHVKEEVGAESGRGMRIVEALASRWGFRIEGARTVVWAEFPAPAAEKRDRDRDRGQGQGRAPLSGPG